MRSTPLTARVCALCLAGARRHHLMGRHAGVGGHQAGLGVVPDGAWPARRLLRMEPGRAADRRLLKGRKEGQLELSAS